MNKTILNFLKICRVLYIRIFGTSNKGQGYLPGSIMEPDVASDEIYNRLMAESPCMIARYGAFELSTIVNYLGVLRKNFSIADFIKGDAPDPMWNKTLFTYMENNAGFFPATEENVTRFCEMMIDDTKQLDILGSWSWNELYMRPYFSNGFKSVHIRFLEPFWNMMNPWTRILTGKKVLVVHPFSELIEEQYRISRSRLFQNPDLLPDFELQTLKSIQSIGGESNGFNDWFEALDWMKNEIDKRDYDFCLLGCGAYGFPLAAHCKRMGKKAIHLGGALQLLFGIKGNRWENPNYGVKEWGISYGSYSNLMNEYWVRPREQDCPKKALSVEGACYW